MYQVIKFFRNRAAKLAKTPILDLFQGAPKLEMVKF